MKRMSIWILTPVLVLLPFLACLKNEPFKCEYEGFAPRETGDGWIISTPESEDMDRALLESAYRRIYDDNLFLLFRSLLVIRNGKLVAEGYLHDPDDIGRIENIQSVTKSFTSILTGIALGMNLLDSLDQTFSAIYPDLFEAHPDKRNITIRQALSMKGGIHFENKQHTGEFYLSDHSVDYVLSRPLRPSEVELCQYNDGYPQLISYAIERRYGATLADFAKIYLFDKLGITDWMWEHAREGTTFGAFSLYLKPRDIAKFGQMLLQNGKWGSETVVDSTWVDEVSTPEYGSPGYYFFVFYKDNYRCFGSSGHGGQTIYIVPFKNLVIVATACPYTSNLPTDNMIDLFELIFDSCR